MGTSVSRIQAIIYDRDFPRFPRPGLCNLIQLNFVRNILVIGQICDANFHPFGDVIPFGDVRDDVTRSLDVCHR